MAKPLNYQTAGVDIAKGDQFIKNIAPHAKSTRRPGVMEGIGGFGALFSLDLQRYPNPVLVSGTDGVGTKILIAQCLEAYNQIGIDLVAMCVNDVLALGAEPLFFLDYLAMGFLDVEKGTTLVSGIAEGCRQAHCSLIGGETAEMPGVYPPEEFDLAGFAVGVVNKDQIIDGQQISPGDIVIGLASNGIHSNGFSLVRKIFLDDEKSAQKENLKRLNLPFPELDTATLGEELLKPTRIYVPSILKLIQEGQVLGLAHITGGGLPGNLPRILPGHTGVSIDPGSWKIPAIFQLMQKQAQVKEKDMYSTFNMGIGMAIVVAKENATSSLEILNAMGEKASIIGNIVPRKNHDEPFQFSK